MSQLDIVYWPENTKGWALIICYLVRAQVSGRKAMPIIRFSFLLTSLHTHLARAEVSLPLNNVLTSNITIWRTVHSSNTEKILAVVSCWPKSTNQLTSLMFGSIRQQRCFFFFFVIVSDHTIILEVFFS